MSGVQSVSVDKGHASLGVSVDQGYIWMSITVIVDQGHVLTSVSVSVDQGHVRMSMLT